jgi:beta-glucosidase
MKIIKQQPGLFIIGLVAFLLTDLAGQQAVYMDATKPIEVRLKDLMGRMTLEDKVAQMSQYVGLEHMKEAEKKLSVTEMKSSDAQGFYVGLFSADVARMVTEGKIGSFLHVVTAEEANLLQELAQKTKLKIPLLIGIDAIHGNGLVKGTTTYPSPISLAATWDDQLQYTIGRQTAAEMRATGSHWAFTPNIDVLRDPRWGRTGETYGEDPFLVGNMGVNTIRGLQGEDFTGAGKVIACAKHLIAGSESINGLNAAPTDVSHRTLMEIYLPPYKRAIKEANVFSIMAAHNEINGVPCHADKYMMTDLLRNEWGFSGFYVSDWNDISRIAEWHHVANDFNEASLMSVAAGMDMNMHGPLFADYIIDGVKTKKLNMERIDEACAKILEAKFKLGLFENPMVDVSKVKSQLRMPAHLATSLEASRKSITLLKNSGVLPLAKEGKKSIFITGPNADNMTILGDWVAPQPEENFTTVKEGLTTLGEKYGYKVSYFDSGQRSKLMADADIEKAKKLSEDADIHVLVLGENSFRHDWPNKTTGENIDRSAFTLSGKQLKLAQAIKKQGKTLVVVYISGSPIGEPWIEDNADAIIYGWEAGDYAGQAIAEIVFGDLNPSGKSPVTIPRSVGQIQMVYNHKPTTYRHKYHTEKKTPQYVFGHGLSYTTYTYSNLKINGTIQSAKDQLTVTVDVANTGKMAGEEIAQLYIRDEKSQVTRPVMELKGYQRVALNPGETKTISFKLSPDHLAYYSMEFDWIMEAGSFQIMAGGSSDMTKLQKAKYIAEKTIRL